MVDYLKKLEEETTKSIKITPEAARGIYRESEGDRPSEFYFYNRVLSNREKIKGAAVAYRLMKQGRKSGQVNEVIRGAQLYRQVGRPKQAIPKLIYSINHAKFDEKNRDEIIKFTKEFIGDYSYYQKKRGTLEGKVGIFIALLAGGIGLGMVSSNITGNVISNSTQTNSSLIGVVLLVIGLVGAFFYFKKKDK